MRQDPSASFESGAKCAYYIAVGVCITDDVDTSSMEHLGNDEK